ncbi:MAG TPA: nucleotide sugar dehydrogenase, partial [Verrucomicrobiae bacterium]|nr:nucleotide sugar dehydrogenase [Verrucomicrobiae bacterium]
GALPHNIFSLNKRMRISIFGLGYVGAVTAGCLADRGHHVIGVDISQQKVELFNQGIPPIIEPSLAELLQRAKQRGRLRATQNIEEAIAQSTLSIVCVGTPSLITGGLDLQHVRQVAGQVSKALRRKSQRHFLVFRSTMLPGSTAEIVGQFLKAPVAQNKLQVFYYPEFLREGTAVTDFQVPSLAVVGTQDGSRPSGALMKALFGADAAVVNWPTAELIKYACNAFHASKIAFANEIGRVAKPLGVDAGKVMSLLCQDTRLNISPYYLRPGNPFGGSCLPKDVRALMHRGRTLGLHLPVLESLLPSNERHLQSLLELIVKTGEQEVAILGLSFKSNTDDLRESAMVELAQQLIGRGFNLRIYDPALNLAALVGSNKRVIDIKMPHLAALLKPDLRDAVGSRGLLVVAQKCAALPQLQALVTAQHRVLDVNGWPELRKLSSRYEGFCW